LAILATATHEAQTIDEQLMVDCERYETKARANLTAL